ncbi:MAG: hypothetical protein AAF551_01220 [Bacteroidota bacterium]
MKKITFVILVVFAFTSCYQKAAMEGFDQNQWLAFTQDCSDYRLKIADHVLKNSAALLESNQNEIEGLLGAPTEHELYTRNQKFFHYRLTPMDSCGSYGPVKFLSIRFNAIGRANELELVMRE